MRKIKDRLLLGVVAGLGANLIKNGFGRIAKRKKWAEIDGAERAAGMLVPPHTLATTQGKVIGYIADSVIGGLLGVATVYALGVTGKNSAILKGALTGQATWTTLYGVLGTLGATKVSPVSPNTVITELVGHTVYGMATALLAVKLGDPGLYDGTIPMSAQQKNKPKTITSEFIGGQPSANSEFVNTTV